MIFFDIFVNNESGCINDKRGYVSLMTCCIFDFKGCVIYLTSLCGGMAHPAK